jgi:8-oxo-dGTP pyrophosphatase MutT (NUDIX family)
MLQPSTGKVVIVQDTASKEWLLPRGRKDVGETLEQAAFREGYEVSHDLALSRIHPIQ